MTERSARYVQPNRRSGGWDVVKPGHKRATAHASTRGEAVKQAREIVRSEGGGDIKVKNEFGKLIDLDTIAVHTTDNVVIRGMRR